MSLLTLHAETRRSSGQQEQLLLKAESSPTAADGEPTSSDVDADADAGSERKRARLSDQSTALPRTPIQPPQLPAAVAPVHCPTLAAPTPMQTQRQTSRGKSAFTIDAFLSNSTNATTSSPNEPRPTAASRVSRCAPVANNAGVGAFSNPVLSAFSQSPLAMNTMSAFGAPNVNVNMAFSGAPIAAAAAPTPEQQIAFMLQQLLQQSTAAAAASSGGWPTAALMGRDGALAALAAAAAAAAASHSHPYLPQQLAGGPMSSWPPTSLAIGEAGSRTVAGPTSAPRVTEGLLFSVAASKSM